MCGICGIVHRDPSEPVNPTLLVRMRDTLAHRGPDDCGCYIGRGAGLAHRRLSIIDLRPEGRQPMTNEDGTVHIVFNGEIYNFEESRGWLLSKGHVFKSRTDTEVILHLYEELGPDCVLRLRGMFAFAIWDEPERRLLLARDRLGQKPLYYHVDENHFAFGSEAKSLVANPNLAIEADPTGLNYYLSLGYVPAPFSAFKGIRKLQPAHYLVYQDGRVQIHRYWRVHYSPKLDITPDQAAYQIRERLIEATKIRLVSDVPLGAFLSGGIDSSAVVAAMSTLNGGPIKTFSIGFEEKDYNETEHARLVARTFGTDHHEMIVEPGSTDVLQKLAWHYDEPYGDSSALPTYYLSQFTHNYVTVALNGDAGDENFAGYPRYLVNVVGGPLHGIPLPLRKKLGDAALLLNRVFRHNRKSAQLLRLLARTLHNEPEAVYVSLLTSSRVEKHPALFSPEFAGTVKSDDAYNLILQLYAASDADNLIDATLNVDLDLYLPDDLLVKVDRASMAVGLEARSPMLDHEFVEFVARLPARFKLSGLTLKHIFKKAMSGLLPDSILRRPKKGFAVPLKHWFRGELQDFLRDILLSQTARQRGYFRLSRVEELIESHIRGTSDCQYELWNLLMFELWHRAYIDSPMRANDDTLSPAAF